MRFPETKIDLKDLAALLKALPKDQVRIENEQALENLLAGINKIISRYTSEIEEYRRRTDEFQQSLTEEQRGKQDLKEAIENLLSLQKLSEVISTSHNLDTIFQSLISLCGRVVPVAGSGIFMLQGKTDELNCIFRRDLPDDAMEKIRTHLEDGIVDWVLAEKRSSIIPDIDGAGEGKLNFILVPLLVRNRGLGVWEILTSLPAADLTVHHLDLLSLLANQAAVAIENTELYQTMNQRIEELSLLNEISQSIGRPQELPELMQKLSEITTLRLKATFCLLYLKNRTSGKLDLHGSAGTKKNQAGDPLGPDLITFTEAMESQKPLVISSRGYNLHSGILRRQAAATIIAVPIVHQQYAHGLMVMATPVSQPAEIAEKLRLLTLIASQSAVAIVNLRLYLEIIETNKTLLEMQHQLVQSAKLASIGELAGGVAHEINNPLQIILGRVQLVRTKLNQPALDREMLILEAETRRIADIVRNLLTFSRKQEDGSPMQRVGLAELLQETRDLVRYQFKVDGILLNVELPEGDPLPVMGHSNHLKQVFLNIANNARQAMADHGTLTITARRIKNLAEVAFRDTGPGMPPEIIHRIFEPFFTTKNTQGTGLGLSVSYAIVKDHKGNIEVESAKGEGTVFTVSLPLADGVPEQAGPG